MILCYHTILYPNRKQMPIATVNCIAQITLIEHDYLGHHCWELWCSKPYHYYQGKSHTSLDTPVRSCCNIKGHPQSSKGSRYPLWLSGILLDRSYASFHNTKFSLFISTHDSFSSLSAASLHCWHRTDSSCRPERNPQARRGLPTNMARWTREVAFRI